MKKTFYIAALAQMKKTFYVTALALVLMAAAPMGVWAEDRLDMGKYTCADMIEESPDDIVLLVFWLDGYFSGKTGDLLIDADALSALTESLIEYCSEHHDSTVLNAIKKLVN